MNRFFWDASALAKRYVAENGTTLVNYIFAKLPRDRMMCLYIFTGEVISIFVRACFKFLQKCVDTET